VVLDREWDLPPANRDPMDQIRFTRNELLLLDYVLTTGSRLIMPDSLDDLIVKWSEFRSMVWNGVVWIERHPEELGILFNIDQTDAVILLAAVPTTFTWGDGIDCGFAVKLKLAQLLAGTYEDDVVVTRREAEQKAIEELAKKEAEEARQREQTRQNAINTATSKMQAAKLTQDVKKKEAKDSRDALKQAQSELDSLLEGETDGGSTSEDQAGSDAENQARAPADA